MRFVDVLQIAFGAAASLFGGVFLLGGVLLLVEPDDAGFGKALIAMALGAVAAGFGSWLVLRAWSGLRRNELEARERTILGLARREGGRLTVETLALETDLTLTEARKALQEFHVSGHCQMTVEDDGDVVYHFRVLPRALPGER